MGMSFPTPFTDLMMTSSEIVLASWQTIWQRTLMMASADAAALTAAERREFLRMYTEKVQAVTRSAQIMTHEMMCLNQQFAIMARSQFLSSGMTIASLATGQNPAGAVAAQSRFIDSAVRRAVDASQKISAAIAAAAGKGLAPVHTAVTANASRLGHKIR